MFYHHPGNQLQNQGYFQILATKERFLDGNTRKTASFRVSLSGMFQLELQHVAVEGRAITLPDLDYIPSMYHLSSPQFSSSMSDTPGIIFNVPQVLAGVTLEDVPSIIVQESGNSMPMRNQIIATINNILDLNLDKFSTIGNEPVLTPLDEQPAAIYCFTFNYIRIY